MLTNLVQLEEIADLRRPTTVCLEWERSPKR